MNKTQIQTTANRENRYSVVEIYLVPELAGKATIPTIITVYRENFSLLEYL